MDVLLAVRGRPGQKRQWSSDAQPCVHACVLACKCLRELRLLSHSHAGLPVTMDLLMAGRVVLWCSFGPIGHALLVDACLVVGCNGRVLANATVGNPPKMPMAIATTPATCGPATAHRQDGVVVQHGIHGLCDPKQSGKITSAW